MRSGIVQPKAVATSAPDNRYGNQEGMGVSLHSLGWFTFGSDGRKRTGRLEPALSVCQIRGGTPLRATYSRSWTVNRYDTKCCWFLSPLRQTRVIWASVFTPCSCSRRWSFARSEERRVGKE